MVAQLLFLEGQDAEKDVYKRQAMRRVEEYWFKFEYPAALSREADSGEELPERNQKLWGIVYDLSLIHIFVFPSGENL